MRRATAAIRRCCCSPSISSISIAARSRVPAPAVRLACNGAGSERQRARGVPSPRSGRGLLRQPDRAFELRQEGEVGGELCLAGAMRPGDAELARDGDRARATEIGSQLEAALTA